MRACQFDFCWIKAPLECLDDKRLQRLGSKQAASEDKEYCTKMPTFVVETNVSENDFPADWHKKATEMIARILGKPVQASDTSHMFSLFTHYPLCPRQPNKMGCTVMKTEMGIYHSELWQPPKRQQYGRKRIIWHITPLCNPIDKIPLIWWVFGPSIYILPKIFHSCINNLGTYFSCFRFKVMEDIITCLMIACNRWNRWNQVPNTEFVSLTFAHMLIVCSPPPPRSWAVNLDCFFPYNGCIFYQFSRCVWCSYYIKALSVKLAGNQNRLRYLICFQ